MARQWPTKTKDLQMARDIIEQYAKARNTQELGLFELVFNEKEKKMNFQISSWIQMLADVFAQEYGDLDGDRITRHVITQCLVGDQLIH